MIRNCQKFIECGRAWQRQETLRNKYSHLPSSILILTHLEYCCSYYFRESILTIHHHHQTRNCQSARRVSINYLLIDLYSSADNRYQFDSPSCILLSPPGLCHIRSPSPYYSEKRIIEWNRVFTNPALLHLHFWLPGTSESHSLFHFSFTCRPSGLWWWKGRFDKIHNYW